MISFYRMSLRGSLTFLITLIVIAAAIISSLVFFIGMNRIVRQQTMTNLESLISEINTNVSTSISIIDGTSKNILSSRIIFSILEGGSKYEAGSLSPLMRKYIEREMEATVIYNLALKNKIIDNIYLFFNESDMAYLSRLNDMGRWNSPRIREIYNEVHGQFLPGVKIYPASEDYPYICFVYNASLFSDFEERLCLIITSSEYELIQKYSALNQYTDAQYFLMEQEGEIILASNRLSSDNNLYQELNEHINNPGTSIIKINGNRMMLSVFLLEQRKYISIILIPEHEISADIFSSVRQYMLTSILIISVCLFVTLFSSYRMTRFADFLTEGIRQFGQGKLNTRLPPSHHTELNEISVTFNNMTQQIQSLIQDVFEKQIIIRDMQIQFLHSQMNPHFLFNVLFTISTRSKISGDETLYEMVQALSRLLHASLLTNQEIKITLSQELEYIKAYLTIQKIRYRNKLDYSINIESDNLLNCWIPRLCIQPIVENAVLHGIEPLEEEGKIIIKIWQEDKSLIVVVEDNGVGFDPSILNCPIKDGEEAGAGHHIALENIKSMFRLLYGDAGKISIKTSLNEGSKVTLSIPLE